MRLGQRVVVFSLLFGCAARASSLSQATDALPQTVASAAPAPMPANEPSPPTPTPPTTAAGQPTSPQPVPVTVATAPAGEDPRISRSPGQPGGVVVLWPRVLPEDITTMNRSLIRDVQAHLHEVVVRALPGRRVEIRPEPERVCRRSGCDATSVSVVFTRHGDGCAVVALVTPPGPVDTTMVPWAARVDMSRVQIPFREPPEEHLKIRDLAPCSELLAVMRQNDASIEAAIVAATPSP